MQKIWQQPFPPPLNITHKLRMDFIAGICVFCVLYVVHPFGINELPEGKLVIVALQYAIVTILFSMLCNIAIPFIFPTFFEEIRWTVLHEIIFLIMLILVVAVANILFTAFQFKANISGRFVVKMVQYTVAIGIIPAVISVLIKQQQLLMKYSKGANEIEQFITDKSMVALPVDLQDESPFLKVVEQQQEIHIKDSESPLLQLTGTNQQENLTIAASAFLFAEASDNYTVIHYLENDMPQKVLYRVTIKNLEVQTAAAAGIFRCHKSYLVNLKQVMHISGNAQGYKLHLLQNKFQLPVSRRLNSHIKEQFADLKETN